jgi:exopolysaccharide production protein ExoZ
MMAKRRNEIQWLRAIAATEVAICHSDLIVKHFSDVSILSYAWYRPFGGVGVELFFIVSGYIMCMRAPAVRSFASFFASRITRIYPLYWFFTTIAVVVGLIMPAWRLGGFDGETGDLIRSYLILPGWGFPILGVGWTLEYEMIFYLLVTAAIGLGLTRRRQTVILAFVLAALGAVGCVLGQQTSGSALGYHIFSPYMFAFGVGWLICCMEQAKRPVAVGSAVVFAAFAGTAVWLGPGWGDHLVLRISVATLVFAGFILAQGIFQKNTRLNRAFWLLGDASFSLYLSHWFVLSATGKALGVLALPDFLSWPVRAAGVGLSIAVGIAFFRCVEKPLDRLLRRHLAESRPSEPVRTRALESVTTR